MALPIEEYALVGDRRSGALIGSNGSVDWLCLPRFDSAACFAALLGTDEHGHWQLCPVDEYDVRRRYVEASAVLETTFTTASGEVTLTDAMPRGDDRSDLVRRVEGVRGTVRMRHEWMVRLDYGEIVPWVRRQRIHGEAVITAIGGPDRLVLRGPRLPRASDHRHVDEFDVVRRSLLTLRMLTDEETGGIVAAPTTSLPEDPGGERNWDYRYCWLRDAALTISALIRAGHTDEAALWRSWLLRAVAGDPEDLQIMYAVDGGRRLTEQTLTHLPGYAGSTPVRIGNGAALQRQPDVLGEVMSALEHTRRSAGRADSDAWALQRTLVEHLADNWHRKDHGLWEIRGPQQRFTHSQAMVWAAFDRAVRAVEEFDLPGPVDRWRSLRDQAQAGVLDQGYDAERNTFVQFYGSTEVDAALLVLPQIGIVAGDDPRMLGTIEAIERDLMRNGLLLRYRTESGVDGLAGDEHPFLACSFWLVSAYAGAGRLQDAAALFDRLCGLVNDVGLLSEEYDPAGRRMVGNFPQAFSHLNVVAATS